MDEKNRRRIAIACQGGGSHAAFTAGALDVLLKFFERRGEYEIVALSGTSGGAVCAFLVWHALSREGDEAEVTGEAARTLRSFWSVDNSAYWKARDPGSALDVLANSSLGVMNLWRVAGEAASGIDLGLQLNPYDWQWRRWAEHWRGRFKAAIQENVEKIDAGLEEVERAAEESPASSRRDPMLFIGAVNALTGEFHVFKSHKKKGNRFVINDDEEDRITVDAVLASAAIPFVFKATRTGEAIYWDPSDRRTDVDEGVYWDGLYSQNPPVRDLTDAKPDEIWVIQIDPEEVHEEPQTTASIEDRRNELAGNVSLNQELYFVRKINELVKQLGDWEVGENDRPRRVLPVSRADPREKRYTSIRVRRIEVSEPLDFASKLDRTPSHLERLLCDGERQAEHFLKAIVPQIAFEEAWEEVLWSRDRSEGEDGLDAVMDFFAEEPTIELVPPADLSGALSREVGWRTRGSENVRKVLEWCARKTLTIEQSRDYRVRRDGPDKKVVRCWALVTTNRFGDPIKGRVEAVVQKGKVESLAVYPLSTKAMRYLREEMGVLDLDDPPENSSVVQ